MRTLTLPRILLKGLAVILSLLLGTYVGMLLGGNSIWSLIDGALFTVLFAWICARLINRLYRTYQDQSPSSASSLSLSPHIESQKPSSPAESVTKDSQENN